MENRAYAFAVGVFTLLLGASVVFIALWLSGKTERRQSYTLESRYPVTGLNLQAPVRYRGIEVGKVQAIEFSPTDRRAILVRVAVRAGTPLTRGTYGQLGTQGVTGLSYVILDDDGKTPELLSPDDPDALIPMRPSFLDELTGAGKDVVGDIRQVAARINALLSAENQKQLMRTLAGLEVATDSVSAVARKIDPALRNVPALTEDARKAFAHADELMVNLNKLTLDLSQHVDTLERVAKGADDVGGAARTVSAAAVNETLPRIHVLLEEIGRTSRSLERLVDDLSEQPSSIVFGRPAGAPGPGEPGFSPRRGATK